MTLSIDKYLTLLVFLFLSRLSPSNNRFTALSRQVVVVKPVKKEIGLAFKKDQKAVVEALEGLSDEAALAIKVTWHVEYTEDC